MELNLDKFKKSQLFLEEFVILALINEGEDVEAIKFNGDLKLILSTLEQELWITKSSEGYELRGKGRELFESAKNKDDITEILEYLNTKAGKKFSTTSQANRKFIAGRLSSGYTIEDCKKVVEVMVDQWKNDARMSMYLRPETLFNATNFETYINLAYTEKAKNSSNGKINEMV